MNLFLLLFIRLLEHSETISNDRSLEAIDSTIMWAGLGLGDKHSQSIDYRNIPDLKYADSMDRHFDEAIAGIKNSLLE